MRVSAPDALTKAYAVVLAEFKDQATDPKDKERLQRRIDLAEAELKSANDELLEYQGSFGDQMVSTDGRYLKLTRGYRSIYYKHLFGDVFAEAIRGFNRIEFKRDSERKIKSLDILSAGADKKIHHKK